MVCIGIKVVPQVARPKGEPRPRRYRMQPGDSWFFGEFPQFNTLANCFVLCRVSENNIAFAKYRPSKFGKHGIVGNERQVASFTIEAISELDKNISVMNITSSAILAIQVGA